MVYKFSPARTLVLCVTVGQQECLPDPLPRYMANKLKGNPVKLGFRDVDPAHHLTSSVNPKVLRFATAPPSCFSLIDHMVTS